MTRIEEHLIRRLPKIVMEMKLLVKRTFKQNDLKSVEHLKSTH